MLGYGPFGRAVLEASVAEDWPPIAVITHRSDSDLGGEDVEHVARRVGISVSIQNPNGEGFASLVGLAPEVLFTVNYRYVLRKAVLDTPAMGGFNIHPSLLPTLRGRAALTWAVIQGLEQTGVTVHRLEEGVDRGDIVDQEVVPIGPSDTSATVQAQMLKLYPAMVNRTLRRLSEGRLESRPQAGQVTYGVRRTPDDGEIDWSWSADTIHNWVRALTKPYPGAFTHLDGERIVVWACTATSLGSPPAPPGTVVGVQYATGEPMGWGVACGDGVVGIRVVDSHGIEPGVVLGHNRPDRTRGDS